jgi:hypothetical protein
LKRLACLLLLAVALTGCGGTGQGTEGSGTVTTEHRDVAFFTRIDLAGTAKLIARVGPPTSLSVRGDDNLLKQITTKVTGGELLVSQSGDFTTHDGITVEVASPYLEGVAVSGIGDLVATGVRADHFYANLSGTGSLETSGRATQVDAELSGVGSERLGQLRSEETRVEVSGTGSASVYATEFLEAQVTGTGSIAYGGDPARIRKRIKGSGSVIARP